MKIRLAIGCGNYLYAEGLKKLLEEEKLINVIEIFTIGNLISDLKEILKFKPDVILSDYNTDFNIFCSLPEDFFKEGRLRILLIGDRTLRFLPDRHLKALITSGIVGILPPGADSDLLKKALRTVVSDELWLDRHTLMTLISSIHRTNNIPLRKREKEIMFHICQGFRNREIAQKLNISEQTVKSHCNRIYKKLGVGGRLQLALYSFKNFTTNKTKE